MPRLTEREAHELYAAFAKLEAKRDSLGKAHVVLLLAACGLAWWSGLGWPGVGIVVLSVFSANAASGCNDLIMTRKIVALLREMFGD